MSGVRIIPSGLYDKQSKGPALHPYTTNPYIIIASESLLHYMSSSFKSQGPNHIELLHELFNRTRNPVHFRPQWGCV